MFIEVKEYDNRTGAEYGKTLINTDNILFIDNYDSTYKIWRLLIQGEKDVYTFYIQKEGYELIKSILIPINETI